MGGLVIYLGISVIFLVVVRYWIWKVREKHKEKFDYNWGLIENAILEKNYIQVCSSGRILLWNQYMEKSNYETLQSYLKNFNNSDSLELLKLIDELYDKKGWKAI